jgi:lipopolysaccharide export LptBFGC system permease protein LptF
MVGIPLGIKQHRKESSAGIGFSIGIAGIFYLFCMAAQSLAKNPIYHAYYIVWIPVVICLVTSAVFTAKNN